MVARDLPDLVKRAQMGDLDAFQALVGEFQDMAVGYALSLTQDFDSAEDAAQESFIQVFRKLTTLRDPKAFPAWLRRIVYRECHKGRRRRRVSEVPLGVAQHARSEDDDPRQKAQESQMLERVLSAIAALPSTQRSATTLYYIDGYTQKEIAGFLEAPVSTIKSRLRLARQKIVEEVMGVMGEHLQDKKPKRELGLAVQRRVTTYSDEEMFTLRNGETAHMTVKKNLAGVFQIRITAHFCRGGTEFDIDWLAKDGSLLTGEWQQPMIRSPKVAEGASHRLGLGMTAANSGKEMFLKVQLRSVTRDAKSVTVQIQALFTRMATPDEFQAYLALQSEADRS